MEVVSTLSLAMGAGWASGINLYATLLMLGILHNTGNIVLPPELQVVANPLILGIAGLMYVVEFFADKIPGVDNLWDGVHTFIRIPAGAILAAGAVADLGPAAEFAGFLLGGSLAAKNHVTKASRRVMLNATAPPGAGIADSLGKDVATIGGLWAALYYPWLFIALLGGVGLFAMWLLPKIWQGIKKIFSRLFGRKPPPANA